ncbi:MAG TPA: methyltransferase domain-containing protein [Casimicrobiaceae bacterium]|nr:methyltransferase domain-containing protein [Casimicrobiaceae bacterium]
MSPPDLPALVAALPERYQPIFGHAEFDADASRACRDRLAVVERIIDALRAALGRAVRVLDIGCAQGYFALSLAARGAAVVGIDRLAANVAVCRALAAENPGCDVRFVEADAAQELRSVDAGDYDVILALSVLHHMCHEQGLAPVQALLASLADRTEAILAETALREEPLYWAAAQAGDPRQLFAGHAFVHAVAHHSTHLSGVARPFLFASNRWWYLGGELARFERWTDVSHQAAGGVHAGTRRYYFAADRLAKHFLLTGQPAARNRGELEREAAFLEHPPAGVRAPALHAKGIAEAEGWLVRELLPGRLVSEIIAAGEPFDRAAVIGDVLDDLCALEAARLYHGDVRTWNLILGTDGRARLIDYGDITSNPRDCAWPDNLFLSFLIFVHELESDELLGALPMRTPAFAPQQFTPELRGWVAALWRRPVEDWTFAVLRDEFRARNVTPDISTIARSDVDPAWQVAVERYLQVLGNRHRALVASTQGAVAERSNHEAVVGRLSTALDAEKKTSGRLAAEAEALRVLVEASDSARLRLASEIATLSGRVQGLASQHEAMQRQIASQQQELERERAETGRWWTATAHLQHELALIRSSWSWRIMTPLRIVRRWLAGFGRASRALLLRSARSGVGWAAWFAGRHPGLKAWIVTRLERHPRVIASLKRAGAFPAVVAPMVVARRDAAASGALGRDGAELLAELEREIERQAVDSSRPS